MYANILIDKDEDEDEDADVAAATNSPASKVIVLNSDDEFERPPAKTLQAARSGQAMSASRIRTPGM
jgi:hypothetical protein